jgi:hypothetical protein
MSTESYGVRSGWVTFAAVVMFAIAFARIITAFTYFDDSNDVNTLAGSIFDNDLWTAGIWDLAIAAFALFAGYSLLGGGGFGRVVAYIWAVLVIVQAFLTMGVAPWWSVTMIGLASGVIYGLAKTGETEA